ncbi:molybdopterin converting factor subunit 1 [Peribacillus castrilensis]|uniref:Molybdopterin synthase sulfur carrier subunit n=1 Tax=Peribacillus frigoritolerans TaxID=450367 RepID=A0AAJ1QMG5_9BACI|nr:molybdopterin converting factor subunit 1 [Peribacillus frigoritolerans]MDM5284111.1 molybdopterin converting factor subunit 1 [Peribacillus frigoritolerans]USK67319.1 molybdopterin converting factor subunit 1 [Peribacillus frigoritolerans]
MITVLFFAGIREEIGLDELKIVEKDDITVQQLKQYLHSKYTLSSFNQIMTSINESFVTDDEIVKDQDIIAFIPPVSGG